MPSATRLILALLAAALLPALELPRESLVKIYVVQQPTHHYRPWDDGQQRQTTGSGAIIEGNRILTNAHVVSDQVFIQVRRGDRPERVRARLQAIAHDADLALLTVDDPAFFVGAKPLPLGELPPSQAEVAVMGFPLGGDTLSVTRGVVSRIEHQSYAHSGVPLLAVQIDAPINPGNSGGPVLLGGAVIGVAMQGVPGAQSIGYIVPVTIVRHVLADLEDGIYQGFPSLGLALSGLESPSARRRVGLAKDETGITVRHVNRASSAAEALGSGDVMLAIDGHQIANDGTSEFRPGERTSLAFWIQQHQIGGSVQVTRLRGGERATVGIPLQNRYEDLHPVSTPIYDRAPVHHVFGGLVFLGVSRNLLEMYGDNWQRIAPSALLEMMQNEDVSDFRDPPVMLGHVLANDVNEGYQNFGMTPLRAVNGRPVASIAELQAAIGAATGEFIEFTVGSKRSIVLDRAAAAAVAPPRSGRAGR